MQANDDLQTRWWALEAKLVERFGKKPDMETVLFLIGVFENDKQVGFARMITDKATFAYLADVFIIEEYRGRGLSKWLMEAIMSHPDLQGLRRMILATKDAHGLYKQFGFTPLINVDRWMHILDPDVYKR